MTLDWPTFTNIETIKRFICRRYGFRKGYSTELASLELTDRIIGDMDQGKIPISIFLDLSKAFDTLDHDILLHKLNYYGIKATELQLLKNYLQNRKQFVEYDCTTSNMCGITTGVPQGSILGPLVFIIYVNDIACVSKLFKTIIYADDTTLYSTLDCFGKENKRQTQLLNFEINLINDWLKLNKLSLNIQKSKLMIFHMPQKKVMIPKLFIDDVAVEHVSEFNFLGLTIQKHLKWDPHINKIASKISNIIGIMYRIKSFVPRKILLTIYNALILPHLNYGLKCWGHNNNRILKLQKKVVRIITSSNYISHSEPLFKCLSILRIQELFRSHQLKFCYEIIQKRLPDYFNQMITQLRGETHGHNTRQRGSYVTTRVRHVFAEKCLRYCIPRILNTTINLITDKIDTHSFRGFSVYVKQFYLKQYSLLCMIQNCYVCNHTAPL